MFDGKVLGEGALREGHDMSVMGNFQAAPGAVANSAAADAILRRRLRLQWTLRIPSRMTSSSSIRTREISAGGGVTLKWEAPAQAQIEEAVAQAKEADVVVAFVGLSPQLEGEEMRIKIDGFDGGDRTSIDLPAPQQKLLEALGQRASRWSWCCRAAARWR